MRFHPLVRKAAFFLLIFLGALILGSIITATLFEKQIGRRILSALNGQLTTELQVDRFELSFLSRFPNLSASLRGVSLLDNSGGLLMQADRMAFSLGLMSFISSEYKLHGLEIADGVLHLRWDAEGKANYEIIRQEASDTLDLDPAESLSFSLWEAILRRIEFDMENVALDRGAKGRIDEARFSGQFNSRHFDMRSQAGGEIGYLESGEQRFLVNQPIEYEADLDIDRDAGQFEIRDLAVQLGATRLAVYGNWKNSPVLNEYDLQVKGDRVDLEDMVNWLPASMAKGFQGYRTDGVVTLAGKIKGQASVGEWPPLDLRLAMDRGRLSGPLLADELKDLSFAAKIQGGASKPIRLHLDSLKGYFARELMEGRFLVEATSSPSFQFNLNGILPMGSMYPMLAKWIGHPDIERGLGEIELQHLNGNGRLAPIDSQFVIENLELGGIVVFDDAGFRIRGENLRLDRGNLVFEKDRMRVEDVKLEGSGNDIELEGVAYRVIPLLIGREDQGEMEFSATLNASQVDFDRLLSLAPLAADEEDSPEKADSLARQRIAERVRLAGKLRGSIEANIASFNYDKVEVENFRGELMLENNEFALRGDLETMGGQCRLKGSLFFLEQPLLEARLSATGINLDKAFNQTHNFGQDLVHSRNLRGSLNTQMIIKASWDEAGNFLNDKLHLQAGIGIQNGELNRLKVMEQFADYVKIEDLRQIRFADLEHYLEIRNEAVFLPVMFLQSNALNISLSGQHQFGGHYRYNVKLNAAQVLTERFRKHDPSLSPKNARRKGFFNLYYTLSGNAENLNVEKARKEVRDNFERSQQRINLIQLALKEEFGALRLINEPVEWEDLR